MPLWRRRPLTEAEIEFARVAFGEEIAWRGVGVIQVSPWLGFGAMVPFGRTILFARWRAWSDFAQAPLGEQGWFVHELMHVWQAQRGIVLAGAKLGALGKGAYLYKPRAGARLAEFNIERQAEIARHLFLARMGEPDPAAPPRDWLEDVWARR
jgi:hypothetical protein